MQKTQLNKEEKMVVSDRIWELRTLKNYTLRKIAEEVHMTVSSVHKRLKKTTAEYARNHLSKLDYYKTLQVKDLERVAHEAWDAWIDSKEPKVIIRHNQSIHPETGAIVETTSEEHRPSEPNHNFLKEYRAALADIREVLGINAAIEINIGHDNDDDEIAALNKFLDGLLPAITEATTTTIN